jgi:CHAD domain-containing protein
MAKAKNIAGMDCAGEAAAGIRLALTSRFEEMYALRGAALDWTDIEGVHDMRVASRRLRGALRDFAPYVRKRRLSDVNDELKKIADALGGVRDEDVAMLALEKLATKAPAEISSGVTHFAQQHATRRDDAREALARVITEERLTSLQDECAHALKRATKPSRHGKKFKADDGAARDGTFGEVGRAIITERFNELQKLSTSLYRPHEVAPLHRMRIAAKRLRYAVELFASCGEETLKDFESEIGKLQTSLGELHDCDVWIENFGAQLAQDERAKRNAATHKNATQDDEPINAARAYARVLDNLQRRAAVWLLDHFTKERTKNFRDALARWDEWESTDFASRLQASLEDPSSADSLELARVTLLAVEAVDADLAERENARADTPDAPE